MRRVAIIGTGISGLVTAYKLKDSCDITVYEARDRVGGHTHTHDVQAFGQRYAIDTGFIVFNEWTYPRFQALLAELGVDMHPTEMSFSVRNDAENLEYNGHTFFSLFAQRRNWVRPRFHRMLRDIVRFNKLVKEKAEQGVAEDQTLGQFLDEHRFNDWMRTNYIVPMTAAIWSSGTAGALDFPFQLFARFFKNHGLLNIVDRPQWFTVSGGSHAYVKKILPMLGDRVRTSSPVQSVEVKGDTVMVTCNGTVTEFDDVVFASHSDQTLKMIKTPTAVEREVLGSIPYSPSEVVLHTDATFLPRRKAAWASWNYTIEPGQDQDPTVSYNMNILQGHSSPDPFVVTLNPKREITPDKVIARMEYFHPVYTPKTIAAQAQWHTISGQRGLHYCGAYWFNGFHEDGVRSAERVVEAIHDR